MSKRDPEKTIVQAGCRAAIAKAVFRGERSRYNRGAVRNTKRWLSVARRCADKQIVRRELDDLDGLDELELNELGELDY